MALLIGVAAAAFVHGEFHSMTAVVWIGLAGTFVLLTVGFICQAVRRTRLVGAFLLFLGQATFLAIPVSLVAARGVVQFDMWRAKRYVASRLGPRLESARVSAGRYPVALRLWEQPPADAPWIIRRFNYWSDGNTYTLSVMDPGVCGRVTSYSSSTRQWRETFDPCWY